MATDQQFCLRWNNHQSTLVSIFDTLLENGSLVDCTLAAEGQYIKAHRVVLSACSPYFEVLMNQHYEKHPIIILKDVKYQELKSMVDYMYRGEVNISQDQLSTFLKAAESLQIKGLSDGGGGETDSGGSITPKRADPPPKKIQSIPVPQPRSEPRKSAAASSPVPSREDSISPSLQKRRRIRRPSQGEDSNDLDSASNTSDILSQGQSAPTNVPSIPPVVPITSTPVITKQPPVESEDYEQSRLDTSSSSAVVPESGLMRAKIEPSSEGLIEPKTEYMDYLQNENSVEDLTLDDDDDMDMSRPGTSQGSNQGFLSWQLANQSGSEEFMGSQDDGVSQGRRDSQGSLVFRSSAFPIFSLPTHRYFTRLKIRKAEDGNIRLPKTCSK